MKNAFDELIRGLDTAEKISMNLKISQTPSQTERQNKQTNIILKKRTVYSRTVRQLQKL